MYRYFQTSDKSSWTLIEDTDKVEKVSKSQGATKLTILAVSEIIEGDTIRADLGYKGPLFFDIDCKDDLVIAAKSTGRLIGNLIEKGVHKDDIEIFASGSKGFHVTVPQKVFSSGRKIKGLPYIYREMALVMYTTGMDFQVYNGGKGTCWRLENIQRDNGKYRVRISLEELTGVASGEVAYGSLVDAPRHTEFPKSPEKLAPPLQALFKHSSNRADRARNNKTDVDSEKLAAAFEHEAPGCIRMMREGKRSATSSFNQLAFTLATFYIASGQSEANFSSAATMVSEKCSSDSYKTSHARSENCEGAYRSLVNRNDVFFSCGMARAVVQGNPCEGCEVGAKGVGSTDAADLLGITKEGGMYFRESGENTTCISSFVLKLDKFVIGIEELDGYPKKVSKGYECTLTPVGGHPVEMLVPDQAWKSRANFISLIQANHGAAFYGTDTDVQKIRTMTTLTDADDVDEVTEVREVGIHFDPSLGQRMEVPVYVEDNMSVNKFSTRGTHRLEAPIVNPPNLRLIELTETNIEYAGEALELLTKINHPTVMAPLLGWICACHFKTHIHRAYKQFPLMNLWGNAGSGKTQTAELVMWLSGCGTNFGSVSMSLPHSTKYTLVDYVTTTTTVPRILEEFNMVRIKVVDYNNIHEILKSAFNGHSISRGHLSNNSTSNKKVGAAVTQMAVKSPIIYTSEQPVDSPPLRQRSISVGMEGSGRDFGEESFKLLEMRREDLAPLSKMLTLKALRTETSEIRAAYDKHEIQDPGMEKRPKFALETILVGLEMLKVTLEDHKVGEATGKTAVEAVEGLINAFKQDSEKTIEEVKKEVSVTEVDHVMETFALMAGMQETEGMLSLDQGIDFHVEGKYLYLDLVVCFEKMKKYQRNGGGTLVIKTIRQMNKLLANERYFVAYNVQKPEYTKRDLTMLDLDIMKSRELPVEFFTQ